MADTRTTYYQKLAKAQAAVKLLRDDSENTQFNFGYVSAEAMINEGRRCLSEAGLFAFKLSHEYSESNSSPNGEVTMYFVVVDLEDDTEHPYEFALPVVENRGKGPDKSQLTAMTSAWAYFLRDLLMIPRGLDGVEEASGAREPEPRQKSGNRNNAAPGDQNNDGFSAWGNAKQSRVHITNMLAKRGQNVAMIKQTVGDWLSSIEREDFDKVTGPERRRFAEAIDEGNWDRLPEEFPTDQKKQQPENGGGDASQSPPPPPPSSPAPPPPPPAKPMPEEGKGRFGFKPQEQASPPPPPPSKPTGNNPFDLSQKHVMDSLKAWQQTAGHADGPRAQREFAKWIRTLGYVPETFDANGAQGIILALNGGNIDIAKFIEGNDE